jgi:hypothetical protein
MAQTLYGRLFSTKTLIRVAFATLSLHSMGTAFAQGVPAGTQPPVYGTTWAAMRVQSHNVDPQTVALESSKAKTMERDARLSAHRTGG